jgi:hypothetical protein|tara:strand:+ start:4481 stop:4780 length:300 start_codon:yes stop_codon:yes gene_type:complete
MSQISDLYRRIDELQQQVDKLSEDNKKIMDIIDDIDKPTPSKKNNSCGLTLNFKEQEMLRSIGLQIRNKRLPTWKVLRHIERKLIQDPHFVHQILVETR